MKKLGLIVTSFLLIFCIMFTGCSKYGKIKQAYLDAGYKESTKIEQYQDKIDDALAEEDKENVSAIHLFMRDSITNFGVALIIEFKSTEDLKDAIEDSDTLKGMISDSQDSEYVSGNCILLFYLGDAKTIFTGTK